MFNETFATPGLAAWVSGAATGIGLFAVVGAQSAFILRQGIARNHILAIIATCAVIDAAFIFASVAGLRRLTDALPWLTGVLLWGGVAFLLWYALQSARRAIAGSSGLQADDTEGNSRKAMVLAAAGFSVINPHFWLDMVVIGSIADNFGAARMSFAAGVATASLIWLTAQGLGARALAPLFTKPRTWRVLDGSIAVILCVLALGLAIGGLPEAAPVATV
ncbi:lysine transporter LysE [Stenotrophomonas ginsengisoli]|uniref:Lysine transporter LysE n=1 Tax=Stenotrophomonas ginsengisoli TaxID=336566 RepID=A0A0R0DHH1_9GAMM|nr:LysE family transporter [Stenotrophomonas ginsengisoli]KRG76856.1 lysine transporter LysE [Stenotrophomonas ginsengisoli]